MIKNIGVMGCGWLGLPLAEELAKNPYKVSGTTTSLDKMRLLKEKGIQAYHITITENEIIGNIKDFLSNIDVLVINIPPKLRGNNTESFIAKMKLLHHEIRKSNVPKILFVSSTAVYGDTEGEVTEESIPSPTTESGKQLWSSEQLFLNDGALKTTIIRFGGLIGPNRHPVTMLSGRQNLSNGNHPVNLIHLNDCIHMIAQILEHEYWNEIFNGVYPLHPSKEDYYTSEAKKKGIDPPSYKETIGDNKGKTVLGHKFIQKCQAFTTSIIS